MAYSATVLRLLISCPSDVPLDDLVIIRDAILRWNVRNGQKVGAVIVPVSWDAHAAAEFGGHPQQILNRQLADDCDLCVAIFANRMGTESPTAPSGTAEEIQDFHDKGKYVGILRSQRKVKPATVDLAQAERLTKYLAGIMGNSLVLEYETDADLWQRIENILDEGVKLLLAAADGVTEQPAEVEKSPPFAEVRARVEARDRLRSTVSQEPVGGKHWFLVLSNVGAAPAVDVQCVFEPSSPGRPSWTVLGYAHGEKLSLDEIGPHREVSFHILVGGGLPARTSCTVSWRDETGRRYDSTDLELV